MTFERGRGGKEETHMKKSECDDGGGGEPFFPLGSTEGSRRERNRCQKEGKFQPEK